MYDIFQIRARVSYILVEWRHRVSKTRRLELAGKGGGSRVVEGAKR